MGMFLDKIFQRRTINRAFDAIDAGDLQALTQALDKGLSPDTRRHLILEKHTFNTDEFLLSHAVRDQHYDVAVLLLERGANPHVYDQVARNLPDSLRLDIDRSECLKNKDLSSVSFQDNPLLHCYVALMSSRQQHKPLDNLQNMGMVFTQTRIDEATIQQWLYLHLPAYEAFQQARSLKGAVDGAGASAPAKKM